jgi:hypothetical protein
MGIKYAHAYTYSLKSLNIDQLYYIACQRLKESTTTTDDVDRRFSPCVDIDVSLIIRGFAKGSLDDWIEYILKLSSTLTKVGFSVHLVCDGIDRYHSKRATIHRITEAQRKKLDLVVKKSQLMLLLERRQQTDSITERNNIVETEKNLRNKIRLLDNALQRSTFKMGEEFLKC